MNKYELSVANNIKALALINVQDIFKFLLTAKDEKIEDRYETEERAVKIAEKYIDIANRAAMVELGLQGWSMKYSMPIANSDERKEYIAKFYDDYDDKEDAEPDDLPCNTCEYSYTAEEALPCCECMHTKVSKYKRRAEQ